MPLTISVSTKVLIIQLEGHHLASFAIITYSAVSIETGASAVGGGFNGDDGTRITLSRSWLLSAQPSVMS